jgi:hypothetical protein
MYDGHSSCDDSVDPSDLCLSCPALTHCYEISVLISVLKWSFEALQSGLWLYSHFALVFCIGFMLCNQAVMILSISVFSA